MFCPPVTLLGGHIPSSLLLKFGKKSLACKSAYIFLVTIKIKIGLTNQGIN